jgi:hypothetical protein
MSFVTTGLIASTLSTVVLYALFSYEGKRGGRFFSRARVYADVLVLRISRSLHDVLRFIGRDLVRQLARYVYHQVLRTTLVLTRRCEDALRNAIRTNKTLAKSVDEERAVHSKLEEVAFHKATVALSEEEKRQHRDKMLQG